MRTIQAPGVEWTETDRSQYSPTMVVTGCWIPMFTNKGEAYKCKEFTSRSAWINYYGEPETEAERYGYAAACEVLNQNGNLFTSRLPYDNEAFNKLVGISYTVTDEENNVSAIYPELSSIDSNIQNGAIILTEGTPKLYDLDTIESYRSDELKAPAGTFVIVDTTGGTYSKVQEDTRKGQLRELVGIVPIVTTAANAAYALSLINVEKTRISAYEALDKKLLNTLVEGSYSTNGLKESDIVYRYNTQGYFSVQEYSFELCAIKKLSATFQANTLGILYGHITSFIEDFQIEWELPVNTLTGMVNFYNSQELKKAELTSADKVKTVRNSIIALISEARGNGWYKTKDNGDIDYTKKIAESLSSYIAVYEDNKDNLICAKGSYVNPDSQVFVEDKVDPTKSCWCAQFNEAIPLTSPIVHGKNGNDSIPETMSLNANSFFSEIQVGTDGIGLDAYNLKDIGIVVYKMYANPSEGNKISYEAVESFVGSLYKNAVDETTKITKFIDTIVNTLSQYVNVFSNCFNSPAAKKYYLDKCDIMIAKPSVGGSLGLYSEMTKKYISVSKSIYEGLNRSFDLIANIDKHDIDIVCDAGIANIASCIKALYGDKGEYDINAVDSSGTVSLINLWTCKKAEDPSVLIWKAVEQKFDNFCKNTRKDCMFIADGLRPLVLQGQRKIVRDTKPENTIENTILLNLPAICGLNTNFGAGYLDWFETVDDYSGNTFWCPPSIKAMGVYVNTDVNYNYWDAPAGINRGTITATDVAFSPTAKLAGDIYLKHWNYAVNYPNNEAIVLEGQKTFQVKTTAFDRVNVRRLFLRLERQCYKVAKYFTYEGNTSYLRQRFVDACEPYFKAAKTNGGIYDYKIICDETNNTAETIDNNELHILFGIKPTKTVEFIIMNFTAGASGSSWEEIMG